MADEYADFVHSYYQNVLASCVCPFLLTILLSLDAYKAFTRKIHWIPGEALVLSALILWLLTSSSIDDLNLTANSHNKEVKDTQLYILIEYSMDIYMKRLIICVFIGYSLPGVVRSGLRTIWGDIGALALTVIWHMCYEVYFLVKVKKELYESSSSPFPSPSNTSYLKESWKSHRIFFIVSYITFFTALILLVVILTCAVIAGKSISKIISQKIPLALSSCCNSSEKQKCGNIQKCAKIEIQILKCWVVTRASRPEYVMARSIFCSFAGLVNTVCVVLLVVLCICNSYAFKNSGKRLTFFYFIEIVFILIGWIVVLFRWFTAVVYFPRDVRCSFYIEDFWTRSIVDMKSDLDAHLTTKLFRDKKIHERTPIERIVVNLITAFRLQSLLLKMALWLQNLMVSFSKACWFLSDIAFRRMRPFIMSPQQNAVLCNLSSPETGQFCTYKEVLEIIRMPGEIAYSLWIANLSAFKKAESNITKGFQKSKGTFEELTNLMRYKTGMVEDEAPTFLAYETHFREVGQKSLKMRAVSIIHFMIYFYDRTSFNIINDAVQACSQAWSFMDIINNLDPKGQLVGLAADKEFDTIQKIWNDHKFFDQNQFNENVPNKLLEEKIRRPLIPDMEDMEKLYREEKTGQKTQGVDYLHDSMDWMAMAAKVSLYKLWKTMDFPRNSVDAIHHLRCLLANIIAHCLEKELDKALIENCIKWVGDGDEDAISNAAFIFGKAKAVWEQIEAAKIEVEAGAGNGIRAEAVGGGGDEVSEVDVDGESSEVQQSEVEAVEGNNALINEAKAIERKSNDCVKAKSNDHPHAIVEVEEVGEE